VIKRASRNLPDKKGGKIFCNPGVRAEGPTFRTEPGEGVRVKGVQSEKRKAVYPKEFRSKKKKKEEGEKRGKRKP